MQKWMDQLSLLTLEPQAKPGAASPQTMVSLERDARRYVFRHTLNHTNDPCMRCLNARLLWIVDIDPYHVKECIMLLVHTLETDWSVGVHVRQPIDKLTDKHLRYLRTVHYNFYCAGFVYSQAGHHLPWLKPKLTDQSCRRYIRIARVFFFLHISRKKKDAQVR